MLVAVSVPIAVMFSKCIDLRKLVIKVYIAILSWLFLYSKQIYIEQDVTNLSELRIFVKYYNAWLTYISDVCLENDN